ncbi:low temperature requirement protein A [Ralstonia solanacearum]|uniref:low temperature requirement protein A n=1 Tax=Ralstonia solanacearum TaxID=305 RepID=UPI0005AC7512|nr:low temperature requirement protein A [Ralstonia solanacearum]MDB0568973.1 low temperature requirement protein A [Ralstonia solanacearum]MDB0574218.1 low temperature requirement protein A [Ralstonia solanacearum]OAI61332.1 membrane protein [Ralstonia solanacearum]
MPRSYLRPAPSGAHGHHRVTNIELFFDLVFVFAVTQLSHLLIGNFTPVGGAQTLLLMLAVWWVWIFTSWVTNWLDPERLAIRLLLLALMTAGLLLSASLPQAFGSRGLAFALAYVFMQFGRTLFFLWAVRGESPGMRRNFQRIAAWLGLSAVFWLAGGLAEGSARWACWIVALGIEWLGPSAGFYTPGLGRSTVDDWNVEGGHMAERCSLFIIIALGESVLVTGSTFAGLDWSPANIAAMAVSFIGSLAMWWLYFDTIAERGSQTISHAADPGRLARLAYTYIHVLLVAGIIVGAVADEFVLAHPVGHPHPGAALTVLGSAALYLLGNLLFKCAIFGRARAAHVLGLVALGLVGLVAAALPALAVSALATLVLCGTAAWEWYTRACEVPATAGREHRA